MQERREAAARDLDALQLEAEALLGKEAAVEEGEEEQEEWEEGELVGGSAKLRLQTSGDRVKGRFVTAGASVAAGEVVVREAPYSMVLLPDHLTTRYPPSLYP